MEPHALTIQIGMTRFQGHLFIAPDKLYFVCSSKGRGAVIGQAVGGLIGAAIASAAGPKAGAAPGALDEAQLVQAVAEHEGSLILEPAKIEQIKHTLFWRLIRWEGKTLGLPKGLTKPLKAKVGEWARANNVKTKGLA